MAYLKGEKRGKATHESKTDSAAKLMRTGPGKEAAAELRRPRHDEEPPGLCVLFEVHAGVGALESQVAVVQAVKLSNRGFKPKTNGGDKAYRTAKFDTRMRELGTVPHPARRAGQ